MGAGLAGPAARSAQSANRGPRARPCPTHPASRCQPMPASGLAWPGPGSMRRMRQFASRSIAVDIDTSVIRGPAARAARAPQPSPRTQPRTRSVGSTPATTTGKELMLHCRICKIPRWHKMCTHIKKKKTASSRRGDLRNCCRGEDDTPLSLKDSIITVTRLQSALCSEYYSRVTYSFVAHGVPDISKVTSFHERTIDVVMSPLAAKTWARNRYSASKIRY